MMKKTIAAACAALLALAAASCSPIVAEYTYRGSVSGTSSRTGARMLTLKEYRDGTVSGKLSIPSSSAMEPYSCGSIGGRADDRRITFYLTSLGDSYLSAKMAVAGNSAGTTIAYRGHISGNLRGGSFSFNLTHINGRAVTRKTGIKKNGTENPPTEKGEIPTFSVESEGAGSTPTGFTVE